MDRSKCLQIVGDFSEEEIAELDDKAREVAGGAEPGNHHYMVAVEQLLAAMGAQAAPAPKAEPAPAPAPAAKKDMSTEDADISDIEEALRRYNNEPDQKKALIHLQWVMDEANENESERVRRYAEQRIREEASEADLKELNYDYEQITKSSDWVKNPDVGTAAIPAEVRATLTDGRTAARWLMANAKEEWHRQIAARLLRFITEDIPIHFVGVGDTVPTMVARSLSRNVMALAYWEKNKYSLYFHTGKAIDETTLLHELIHAATMRALRRATGDRALTDRIDLMRVRLRETLRQVAASSRASDETKNAAGFFEEVLDSADELLAYAFSSSTLRRWLQHAREDGTIISDAEAEMEAQVAEGLARRLVGDEPTAPTLWQRFVDYVRELLGIGKVYQPRFEQMLQDYDNRFAVALKESRLPTFYEVLDQALESAMQLNQQKAPAADGDVAVAPSRGDVRLEGNTDLPAPQAQSKVPTTLREMAGGWRNFPGALGWLTNRQLAERFSSLPAMQKLSEFIGQMSSMAKNRMQEAHLIDLEWSRLDKATAVEMQRLMLESTLEKMHIDLPLTDPKNKHINASDPAVAERYRALAKRWEQLPSAAKEVYRKTEAKFRKDWNERGELLKDRIIDQYRTELAPTFKDKVDEIAKLPKAKRADFIESNKLSRNAIKSLRSLWGDLDAHAADLSRVQGPYFPLVRFGNHVVVAKSPRFLRAQTEYQDAVKILDALNDDDKATAEDIESAREDVAKKREAVAKLKDNPRDYVVEFYETNTEAKDRETQLKKFYADRGAEDMEVYSDLRTQHFARLDSVSPAFMNKLEETLRAGLPDKDASTIRAAVRDLYIQSMPERSALKAQLSRMNVRGAKVEEVRRAFAASAMRNAWHLSRLKYNLQMHESLTTLREGASKDSKLLGAEMGKRFVHAMTYDEPNMFAVQLAGLGYFSYLGLSPSFLLLNMSQPWVVSVPIMAARFGMGAPTRAMATSTKEVAQAMRASIKDQNTWRFELDLDKFTDPNERQMLANLFDKGIIDITIEHDLGSVAAGSLSTAFGKAMQIAALPAHHAEVFNRVSTALAAYRLDKGDSAGRSITGTDAERKATAYAEKIVAETHLDYTPENAPRLMRSESLGGFGRLVFQFKKYSQGMIYLIAKNLLDATRGDKEALKASAYLMGMTAGVAGTAGLPIAAPVGVIFAAIAKMYDDDDEPEIGLMLYNGLKAAIGEAPARAIVKGLPAAVGVDLSERIGMGQILDPFGLTRDSRKEPFTRDWVAEKLLSIAGPAPSMAANWLEAMSMAADGDVTRAASSALPKFIADPIRAMSQASDGITARNGDTLVSKDELGLPEIVLQAVGFKTTDVTDMYQNRAAMAEVRQNRDDTRTRLIREFVRARLEGSDVSGAREAILDFNSRHPTVRVNAGQLEQAVARQRQQDRQMRNGVHVSKRDAELAGELGLE